MLAALSGGNQCDGVCTGWSGSRGARGARCRGFASAGAAEANGEAGRASSSNPNQVPFGAPHVVLGVQADPNLKDVKRAYRRLALLHHPDMAEGCEKTFGRINDAYNALINQSNYKKRAPRHHWGPSTPGTRKNPGKNFGSRAPQGNFHTPNPYKTKSSRLFPGDKAPGGVRQSLPASHRFPSNSIGATQRSRHRVNFFFCAIPFAIAVLAFSSSDIRRSRGRRKKNVR